MMHDYQMVQQPKLHELCATFPNQPDCEIDRDHLLDTFERMFSGPVDLLVLEGDQGTGKTTLLSQFARRYPTRSISSFVTPDPRYNYDHSTLIRDYTAQILSILEPRKSSTPERAGDGVLQRIIHNLKRRRGAATYYFLLDGLTDITDDVIMSEVTNLLPIGQGFPVIVSGEAKSLPSRLANSRRTKIIQTVNFSLMEVRQYLVDLSLTDADVKQVYQECRKGVPANLSSIRRSLLAGIDLEHLQGLSIKGLFEQEWRNAVTDERSEEMVAIIAHSRHRLTIDSLSAILKSDDRSLLSRLRNIPFLQLDSASYVSFISHTFADFAVNRLSNRKGDVIGKLVGHLLDTGGSDAADRLPTYLQESGRSKEVISFLSPDYFSNALKKAESFAPLRKQFRIGIDVSTQRRDDGSLIRFGLGSSAIREIETSQVSRSEVEALVTTDQIEKALSLAANCPLREDRLHLLAVIARCEKELGMPVSDDIVDQIKLLFGQVNTLGFNDKAIDIAADLFPCFPDLSIKLIERSSQENDHENELDIAYLRLSIATAVRQIRLNDDKDDLEKIRKRIKDPKLRGYTSTLFGNVQTAAEVIAEAKRLETTSDKLYVLRKWSLEHSKRGDAVDVAAYGLETIVEATDYAPNVRVLRELSTSLTHVEDSVMARSLVRSFDGQRTTVEDQGPTEEAVRMQLNLAFAESLYDKEACANRLVEVYLTIDELIDSSTKSSCFAWLLSTLQTIDSSGEIEDREHLKSLSIEAMNASISDLLAHTAYQVDVTRRVIDALASFDPNQAFALAGRLNTLSRREEARLLAIDATLENETVRVDLSAVRNACGLLHMSDSRDHAAASVAEYLVREASEGKTSVAERGFEIFRDVFFSVSGPTEKCRVLCLLYALSEKGIYAEDIQTDLSRQIKRTLNDLDSGWIEIDVRFRLARAFANWLPAQAKEYLRDADESRRTMALSSFSSEWTFQACLRLSMRAFAGQLGHGYDAENDISRLGELIERLPNTSMQAQLWGELAMHLYLKSRSDEGDRIVYEHVTPLLDSIPEGPTKSSTIIAVSPALFRSHKTTAMQSFSALESHDRDSALMTCAKFTLGKHIPSDPYEEHESGYSITFQDAIDVAELAGEIHLDSLVYSLIVALADTLVSKGPNNRFSRQQQARLVSMINEIAGRKFPDQDNIQHDGFKIASDAQLLRIVRAPRKSWDTAIDRAKRIPNKSDSSYVAAIIGKILPASMSDRVESLFEDAIEDARAIPCNYDRLARLNDLAGMMVRRSPRLARECLREAITGFQSAGDSSGGRITREIIDTAFKIDADFAASLVPLMDDDPARTMAREEMKRRVDILRKKKAIVDGLESWEGSESGYPDLPSSAWLALGSLNAGRMTTLAMDQLRPALRYAGRCALRDGFPILAWAIENVARRSSGSRDSRSVIRLIFEGTMSATELVELAATSASINVRRPASALRVTPSDGTLVIRSGERRRAEDFLSRWLRRSASGHLYICDQYFRPTDLKLLMLIQSAVPDIEITVLTSRHCHQRSAIRSLSESYRSGWKTISDQTPPKAEIVVVGLETSGKSPIHDRSILSEASGIVLGTSWNSLGLSQDSTMRELSERELLEMSQHVEKFILKRARVHRAERLLYEAVTL